MVLDPPKEKVDVTLMIIFSFIPILGIYAAWRIQKFWMILLIEMAISIVFTIAIIPVAFILAEMSMFIGLAAGIAINVLLVKHYAEKYNEKMGFASTKSEKITDYITTEQTPIKIPKNNETLTNIRKTLENYFTKKGLIIGIVIIVILSACLIGLSHNAFIMVNDNLYPLVNAKEVIKYDDTPFNEIQDGDLIVYKTSGITWVRQVVGEDPFGRLFVKNTVSENEYRVGESMYVGKVTTILPESFGYFFNVPAWIAILTLGFFIPTIFLKIRKIK